MRHDTKSNIDNEVLGAGIQPTSSDSEWELFATFGRALWRNRFLLGIVAVLGAIIGFSVTYLSEVRYTAYAQVMIQTRVSNDQGFAPAISGLPTSLTALESELEVLRSSDLVEGVVNRLELWRDTEFVPPPDESPPLIDKEQIKAVIFGLLATIGVIEPREPDAEETGDIDEVEASKQTAVRNARDMRVIEQVGNVSAVFVIGFTSQNPEKAARLANALAEEYVDRQVQEKLQSLERSQEWLTDRTEDLQLRLAELSVELENHLLNSPFTGEDVQTKKASRNSLEAEKGTLEAQLETDRATLQEVNALLAEEPVAAARLIERPTADLLAALNAATVDTPRGQLAVREAVQRAAERLSASVEQRAARLQDIDSQLTVLTDQLVGQALYDARRRQIENDIRVNEAIYQDFVSQLSRRTQQDQFLDPDSRIISYARAPLYPSEPQRMQTAALASIAALFFVSALVLLRELLQDRLRTVAEYENATGTTLMGLIPTTPRRNEPLRAFGTPGLRIRPSMVTFARKLYNSIVVDSSSHSSSRNLRGRVSYGTETESAGAPDHELPAIAGERGQLVVAVGALPNEGTSTLALLIAAACGDAGERVVLLDCDFWKSPFRSMAVTDTERYTDALFKNDYVDQIAVATSEVGVDIVAAPADITDPTALMLSGDFRRFVTFLTERYDRVIIDAPPLLRHIDTAALYRIADTVILAARWNHTRAGAVSTALKVLRDVGVVPSAVVATRVNLRRASAYGDEVFNYARAIQ